MTTKRKPSHDDSLRLRELKKNTKRAEDVIGNLDYIDEIPPPKRPEPMFPYGDNGVPMPWGTGTWR
ncbi:MAG: hypothetical protein F4X29_11740 [Rhodothermaceae bacterium]|nr:hypothetical protein [Rhodothermaceae bacterium]